MTKAARSVSVFGMYLLAVGAWLLISPTTFLRLFRFPESTDVWIRVLGMVVIFLGTYYRLAAKSELTPFFHWTVNVRASVIIFFTVFVLAQMTTPMLLLFGLIDLLAAGWTASALRADARAASG